MVLIDKNIEIVTPFSHHFLELFVVSLASFPCLLQNSLQKNDILPHWTVQDVNLQAEIESL